MYDPMNFRPRSDRLLVKRLDASAITTGGVHIPEQHRERPQWGEVVNVGPGRVLESGATIPVGIPIGAKVLFGKYSGTEIKIEGVEYLILREDEILGDVVPRPAAPDEGQF